MSINTNDVKKIANLARLEFSEQEIEEFTASLAPILDFVDQINNAPNLEEISPAAHALPDISQPLRADIVTETNQRELFQVLAPNTEAGLYLVPQVIEEVGGN